jgi:intracellular multiplication protein IcmV
MGIVRFVKRNFNVLKWVHYDYLKIAFRRTNGFKHNLHHIIQKNWLRKKSIQNVTSFQDVQQRLGLSDEEIICLAKRFTWIARAFLLASIMTMSYAFWHSYGNRWSGWLLAMICSLLWLANAFRFSFWAMQYRQRQLGCTLRSWWKYCIIKGNL